MADVTNPATIIKLSPKSMLMFLAGIVVLFLLLRIGKFAEGKLVQYGQMAATKAADAVGTADSTEPGTEGL